MFYNGINALSLAYYVLSAMATIVIVIYATRNIGP